MLNESSNDVTSVLICISHDEDKLVFSPFVFVAIDDEPAIAESLKLSASIAFVIKAVDADVVTDDVDDVDGVEHIAVNGVCVVIGLTQFLSIGDGVLFAGDENIDVGDLLLN